MIALIKCTVVAVQQLTAELRGTKDGMFDEVATWSDGSL